MAAQKRKAGLKRKPVKRKAPRKKAAKRRGGTTPVASSIRAIESAEEACTPRQVRFACDYVNTTTLNATKAAELAGCPPESAGTQGSKWLKNPKVAALIAELKRLRAERVLMDADDILRELLPLCVSDVRNLITSAGRLATLTELIQADPNVTKSIKKIKEIERINANGQVECILEYTLHGKVPALALAGKHVDVNAFNNDTGSSEHPTHIVVYTGLGPPPGGGEVPRRKAMVPQGRGRLAHD